jgi:MarR family transcriptional regulator for hemolysin
VRFIDNPEDRQLFAATRAIVVAARAWRKLANERVKPFGQTMARWETLYNVALVGGDFTQRDLAERLGVEGPTLVRMLDRLAKDGLIERRQSSDDGRVTHNRITSAGIKTIEQVMTYSNSVRAEVLGAIDRERLRICVEVLLEIIDRLDHGQLSQPAPSS